MLIKEKLRFITRWACTAPPPLDRQIAEAPCPRCEAVEKAAFDTQVKCTILLIVGYLAMSIIVSVLLVR